MTTKLTCINCPRGCELTVEVINEEINVSGNNCLRGKQYAIDELKAPKRIVTSSITVINGDVSRVSLKTEKAIPKELIFDCMKEIKKLNLKAPIKIGDILIENVLNTNVNVVATSNVKEAL